MSKEKVIECINLEKKYFLFEKDYKVLPWLFTKKGHLEERIPLTDINLTVYEGDVVGFIGKNGAGKSTLMKIIAGITSHTDGGVKVKGKVNSLINLGAGFNPKYTGRQNIYYKGLLMGMSKEVIDSIIDDIIEFCELGTYFDLPLYMYSSGMSARLGFSLAIFADHDILIVDEVFAVGDKNFRQKSAKKMEELFKSGKSIIFASHSDDQIRQFCNRAIFIDDSRIVVDGTVEEALKAYNAKYAPHKVQEKVKYQKFDSANSIVSFNERIKLEKADVYRELGILHEKEDELELAYKYMSYARHLRPMGQLIINKALEYERILGEEVTKSILVDEDSFGNVDRLFDLIKNGANVQKADVYREIGIFHELEGNLELAYKYMSYAKELRPTGSFIIDKLNVYSKRLNL